MYNWAAVELPVKRWDWGYMVNRIQIELAIYLNNDISAVALGGMEIDKSTKPSIITKCHKYRVITKGWLIKLKLVLDDNPLLNCRMFLLASLCADCLLCIPGQWIKDCWSEWVQKSSFSSSVVKILLGNYFQSIFHIARHVPCISSTQRCSLLVSSDISGSYMPV